MATGHHKKSEHDQGTSGELKHSGAFGAPEINIVLNHPGPMGLYAPRELVCPSPEVATNTKSSAPVLFAQLSNVHVLSTSGPRRVHTNRGGDGDATLFTLLLFDERPQDKTQKPTKHSRREGIQTVPGVHRRGGESDRYPRLRTN